MKKHVAIFYTPRFLIVFTLISLSIIGVSANRVANKKQGDLTEQLNKVIETTELKDIKITNKTAAFNVINEVKMPRGIIRLTLRNDYDRNITAYKVSIGYDEVIADSLLGVHDESIAPGHSKDELLPINLDPELKSKGIIIQAVVFDDGTADGYAGAIKEIQDDRIGAQKQIEHLYNLLNNYSMLSTTSHLDILKDMQANMLSEDAQAELSSGVRLGIHGAKNYISLQIEEILNRQDGKTEQRFEAFSDYLKEKALTFKKYVDAIKVKTSPQ